MGDSIHHPTDSPRCSLHPQQRRRTSGHQAGKHPVRRDTPGPVSHHALGLWGLGHCWPWEDEVYSWNSVLQTTVSFSAALGFAPLTPASECNRPGQSHDLSVDIWATGMLTLQLFLGYEELPGLDSVVFKSQAEIESYLGWIFAALGRRGQVSDAGKSFIRGCLAYDSETRPTARQAFYHAWLQESRSDREMFKRLEADNALSWEPQRVKFPVVEDLTAWSSSQQRHLGGDQRATEDTTSPHFRATGQSGPDTRQHAHSSPPPIAPTSGKVQAKRKASASNTENTKRRREAPH